jgi:ABC-type glycerol-3-phosphate transport system substrate-binding protein
MKKKLLVIFVLILLPVFITSCTLGDLPVVGKYLGGGDASKPSSKPVTLTMWGLWEDTDVVDALVREYQQQYPHINVVYDDRSITDLGSYKEAVLNRSSQKDFADIVMVHNSWIMQLKDNLDPVPGNVLSTADYSNKFYRAAEKASVSGDSAYAMPLYYDGIALVYNKAHFEEVGQTSAPTSWEEFRTLAQKLTEKDGETVVRYGAAIGTVNNIDFFPDIMSALFHQAGAVVPNDFDKRKAYDAFAYYTKFAKDYGVWSEKMPEASKSFAMEKVSMIFVPSWNLLDILNSRSDLDIGVAPIPQIKPKEEDYRYPASFWMLAVPSGSQNKNTAWNFINYMVSEDSQLKLFSEASKRRLYGPPYALQSLKQQLSSNEYLEPYLRRAELSSTSLLVGRAGNNAQVDALRTAYNNLFTVRNATPQSVLVEAKENFYK